jgi:hypothetical protein
MIEVRKFAAVDIAFLGAKVILAEFALGVAGPIAVGAFSWWRASSRGGAWFGAYLVSLGVNSVPLLIHAIDITRRGALSQRGSHV